MNQCAEDGRFLKGISRLPEAHERCVNFFRGPWGAHEIFLGGESFVNQRREEKDS